MNESAARSDADALFRALEEKCSISHYMLAHTGGDVSKRVTVENAGRDARFFRYPDGSMLTVTVQAVSMGGQQTILHEEPMERVKIEDVIER